MDITDTTDPVNYNPFAIKKFIKNDDDSYYVVIKPFDSAYKIKIKKSDYHKGLQAYYQKKSVSCYPVGGNIKGDTFEGGEYRIEIADNI